MPTDLDVVWERKRNAQAQGQADTAIAMILVWFIVSLVMLLLLFADQSFSRATIEWECLF
jgi:competence protein ComGC